MHVAAAAPAGVADDRGGPVGGGGVRHSGGRGHGGRRAAAGLRSQHAARGALQLKHDSILVRLLEVSVAMQSCRAV